MKNFLRILLPLIWALGSLGLEGCAHLDNDITPSPDDTLAAINLVTDSTGAATVRLGDLTHGYPATLTLEDSFQYGTLVADSGGLRLRYQAGNPTGTRWKADSARFTLCIQTAGGNCHHSRIKIRNCRYQPVSSKPATAARQEQTIGALLDFSILKDLGGLAAAFKPRPLPSRAGEDVFTAGQLQAWAPPGFGRPVTVLAFDGQTDEVEYRL